MSYYRSADEMAGDLSLGVFMLADPDPRVLNRHDRLSGYAADPAHGARIYNLVKSAMTRQGASAGLAGKVVWVAAPWGSLHHLPWVIGLAEHAARDGLLALLTEGDDKGPLASLAEGGGRPIPGSILPRGAVAGAAHACPTDLEGVSVVQRGSADAASHPLPLESRPWCLLRADALPESLDGSYESAGNIDGVILVAPFRDHSKEELTAVVRGLRKAGHRVLGLVAVGPREEASATAPSFAGAASGSSDDEPEGSISDSERFDSTASCAGADEDNSAVPAEDAVMEAAGTIEETGAGSSSPSAADDGPRAVPLITSWDKRARRRRSSRPVVVALLAATIAVAAFLLLKDHSSRETEPLDEQARQSSAIQGGETAAGSTAGVQELGAASDTLPASPEGDDAAGVLPELHGEDSASEIGPALRDEGASVDPSPLDELDDDPRRLRFRPIAEQIAGEDELGSSEHDDGHWDFLDGLAPEDTVEADQSGPGFGVAIPTEGVDGEDAEPGHEEGYVVHLSSFRLRDEADREVRNLSRQGISARYTRVVIPGKGQRPWYRVLTGLSATFAEAESLAMVLMSDGKIPYAHIVGRGGHGDPVPVGTLD